MGYKIGIDFGTTNSTVSYITAPDILEAFRYPGPDGYEYIPSYIAYDSEKNVRIGRAALDFAGDAEVTFCSNLKMILPLSDSDRVRYVWPQIKPPELAIADYLKHILITEDEESSSFVTQKGQIDGIILSVPHVWAKGMEHAGRIRLQNIITDTMQLPLIQLISEPVAAAAYYAYRCRKDGTGEFQGNLLVCDMGGGTFDVTLCRVRPSNVEELHNDGNGRFDLGSAGVRFDRKLILNGLSRKGQPISENTPEFYEIYKDLQDYKAHHHSVITRALMNAIEDPDLRKRPILKAGKYGFDYSDIQDAFEEIEIGITDVLTRFKQTIIEKGYSIDAVFFVGGFSQFYLVRETIKNALGIEQHNIRLISDANREISRFAISYGAALVANGLITVEEKFEHTIGIEGYQLVESNGVFEKKNIPMPVIRGGKSLSEYEKIHFADFPVKVHHEHPEIVIFIDPESKNSVFKQKLPETLNIKLPETHTPGNEWKVGMRVTKSKIVYLVFEDKLGHRIEFELGDILRQLEIR